MSQASESTEVLCMEVDCHSSSQQVSFKQSFKCHSSSHSSVIQGVIMSGNACGHGLQYVPSEAVPTVIYQLLSASTSIDTQLIRGAGN